MSLADNPFGAASDLPYHLPPFDRINDEHFLPAVDAGIAEQAAEVEAIVAGPAAPTFDNTVLALERSGALLTRVTSVLFNLVASDTDATRQEILATVAPKLTEHRDAIYLNTALYERVDRLYQQRDQLGLDAESDRLLERYRLDFQRAGAGLGDDEQRRLRELNTELSTRTTRFQENLLADTNALAVAVTDRDELAGLDDDLIAAAAEAAGERGGYILNLRLPTVQPELATLDNRNLRARLYAASAERGKRDNEYDNKALLAEIARLRAERAALLGYPNHAAYVIADETAGTADAANELMRGLVPAAVANAKSEAAELQAAIEADGAGFELGPHDWPYYAERVRKARFAVDSAELRPYFELERVLTDGVFFAANRLYGLTFTERTDLPTYHPEVRVFEVTDADGNGIGLFLGDYFTRDGKRGGAWMNTFVDQSTLTGYRSVVVNNLNIPRPQPGEPALLTFDEVETAFHEFGHALHALLSDVRYPTFSGTNVPRDFVEFPSQVNEMWVLWPEVLANYAKHYQTGEPLPTELADRLRDAQRYGQGFRTTEYLGAALLDQAWHALSQDDTVDDVLAFEAEALAKAGVAMDAIAPRYRSTYFAHIFSTGYAAAYYSYIWSEVLDADTVDWFAENGGLTRENGDHFRRTLLSRGGGIDPMRAFHDFRGRDPELEPLLLRRGLTR